MTSKRDKAPMSEAIQSFAKGLEHATRVTKGISNPNKSGSEDHTPSGNPASVDQEDSGSTINDEDPSAKEIDKALIQSTGQQRPKQRLTTRKQNPPTSHTDKPQLLQRTEQGYLETEQNSSSKYNRKRHSRSKYRTTAVQAAFKSLESPPEDYKKAMSKVYPPLLEDESKFAITSDEDCEEFKEGRVMLWDPIRNRKVAGAASPLRKNLDDYLKKKRSMQVFYGQDSLLKRDKRAQSDDFGWNDHRNEVVIEQDEIPMCKLVRSE